MIPFNWVDVVMIAVMGISGLVGLFRGLVKEVVSLMAWGLAIWAGIRFSPALAVSLESFIPSPTARVAAAFGLLFILTLILAGMLGFLLTRLLESTGLSGIDRLAGLLFGIARGALLITVLVFLARTTPLPKEPLWQASQLIPLFQNMALWLESHLPPGFVPKLEQRSSSH